MDILMESYEVGDIDMEGLREEVDTFMFGVRMATNDFTSKGNNFIVYWGVKGAKRGLEKIKFGAKLVVLSQRYKGPQTSMWAKQARGPEHPCLVYD